MGATQSMNIAVIGLGGFGRFCLDAWRAMPDLRVVAVCDSDPELLRRVAGSDAIEAAADPFALVARKDIDLVHIATPPGTHEALASAALAAGKHVLCEKPLAVSVDAAERLLEQARAHRRILPVNFILRYLPITEHVRQVLDSGLLGAPLRAVLENYATDAPLPPAHWFWDRGQSGGIFIEHGVHFFNLYESWFGPGQVVSAHVDTRPDTSMEDRVTCLVRHGNGVLAGHYHGFDQPAVRDRATHRILCERGDIVVSGWIPEELQVEALVTAAGQERLRALLPGATVTAVEMLAEPVRGRGVVSDADRRVAVTLGADRDKPGLYRGALTALMADQLAFIRDPAHRRTVSEADGLRALDIAVAADRLARVDGRTEAP